MPDARKPARRLWDRFWIRLLAYLIGAPVVIMAVDMIGIMLVLVISGAEPFQAFTNSNMVIIALWAGAQVVPLIVPLILVELGNRRRGWAVPPGLCTLFVSAFSAALTGTILGASLAISRMPFAYRYTSGVPFAVIFILASCILAGAVSWALVSPLIRRWAVRNASARDLAEHF